MKIKFITIILLTFLPAVVRAQLDTARIYFELNSAELSVKNKQVLDSIDLQKNSVKNILGFTDNLGVAKYNYELSKKRALAVKNYFLLIHKSFDAPFKGQGALGDGTGDLKGNPKNRRVEIITSSPLALTNAVTTAVISDSVSPISANIRLQSIENEVEKLSKLRSGESIELSEINFLPGRHLLAPASVPLLKPLLEYLLNNTMVKIEIRGHICCNFDLHDGYDYDTKDQHLSLNRAKLIFDYLRNGGIDTKRLKYKGMGSREPKIYPEVSKQDQDLNRRVQILIL